MSETMNTIGDLVDLMSEPSHGKLGRLGPKLARFSGAFAMLDADHAIEPPGDASTDDVNFVNTSLLCEADGDICLMRATDVTASSVRDLIFDSRGYAARRLVRADFLLRKRNGESHGATGVYLIGKLSGRVLVGAETQLSTAHSIGKSARANNAWIHKLTDHLNLCWEWTIPSVMAYDFTREMCWTVKASAGGIPISFLTDATGVRETLKFRDVAAGKKRRDALAHWVSAHSRRLRADDDATAWVRKHIRGRWECEMEGLKIQISAPPDEVRAAAIPA